MTRLIFNQLIHLFLKFWKEVNQRWLTNLILMEKKWVFLLELKQWHWLFSQVFPSKGICKVHFSCDQGISFVLFLCFLLHPIDMLVMGGLIFPLNMWRSPFYYSPPQSFLGFGCFRLPSGFFLLRDITTRSGTFPRHSFLHLSESILYQLSCFQKRNLRSINKTSVLINLHYSFRVFLKHSS